MRFYALAGNGVAARSAPHPRGFAAPEDARTAVCVLPGTELAFAKEVRERADPVVWLENENTRAHNGHLSAN
jgi:hypothetical protein